MKKSYLIPVLLIAAAAVPTACTPQTREPQETSTKYYEDGEGWSGPGWYYGIYYSREDRYRHRHRSRGYRHHRNKRGTEHRGGRRHR